MTISTHKIGDSPEEVEKWFKNVVMKQGKTKEKITKLHFYFHDLFQYGTLPKGVQPTSYRVAQADITLKSPSFFGSVLVADDPLTVGPNLTSKTIGRAQGFYASASFKEFSMAMNMNFIFTHGKYNGSTLSLTGWNPTTHLYREMSIVGGSGFFRMARGVATAKTIYFEHGVAIVEYNVIVLHY